MKKVIAYIRTSTKEQNNGLVSQFSQIEAWCANNGATLVGKYVEQDSGRNAERIELHKAIDYARKNDVTIVAQKLDRISRSVKQLFALMDGGVSFAIVDMPQLNTMTLGIYATLAQYEAELISERTKAGLKVAKANGKKIGSPENLTNKSRAKSIEVRSTKSQKHYYSIMPKIRECRSQGMSFRAIADELNSNNMRTSRGNHFHGATVKNLVSKYK